MDLGPIEERANEFATWVGKFDSTQRIPAAFASAADVSALLAEVKRLTAEVQERDEWLHETAALLPEGFDGDEWDGEVIARFIRQAARPAPAWDEDTVQAEVLGINARHHFHGTACLCGFDSHGRTESEIKAEALRDAADEWHAEHYGTRPAAYKFLWDRADQIVATEGGADRG